MKKFEYYPPEMKPTWWDWVSERWDLIGLITMCIVTVLIGVWAWFGGRI